MWVLRSPACGLLPCDFTEGMALASVGGSKTNLEYVVIKRVLLGGGKRSDKYLETV